MKNYIAEIIIGSIVMLVTTGVIALVTSYLNRFKSAINALHKNQKASAEEAKIAHAEIAARQAAIEIKMTEVSSNTQSLIKDVARIEGYQSNMQTQLSEVTAKVEKATGRLEAAFRFIDNAPKRATDFGD